MRVSNGGKVSGLNPEVFKTVSESTVYGTACPATPSILQTTGNVIFISYLAGIIRDLPSLFPPIASKIALRTIEESIRLEEAEYNIYVGLIFTEITDNEHNKEAIAINGKKQILASRKGKKVQSTESVALAVLRNIECRNFTSILTWIGKLNYFLQPPSHPLSSESF